MARFVLVSSYTQSEAFMDISNIGVLNLLQNKMHYASERQEILSQNIANVDTPKYKRQELRKPDFAKMVKSYDSGLGLSTTNEMHISPIANNSGIFSAYDTEDKVELDQEAVAMMENRLDYNSATATYKKILSILRDVANSNK
jgi:flagellar basal-body rod protein FlgB